jgi:outer membrane protein OmpU
MKKLLLASAALATMTGYAAAEVTVGGDGRMGIIYDSVSDDWAFTSRIRISFTASGETDGGLTFGGSIRADNAVGGKNGTAGNVYIQGSFGKLSMGDVDAGDQAAVGEVSGVGLTGLGDRNELGYDSDDTDTLPRALYQYSAGDFTGYLSLDEDETWAVGAKYTFGGSYTVALGYSKDGVDDDTDIHVGVTAGFGAATVKAIYEAYDGVGTIDNQYALSLDYVMSATTVTVFYKNTDYKVGPSIDAYGLGASYDLGGGASLKGGIVSENDITYADFGVAMKF